MTLLPTHLGGLVILELEKCGTSPANARSTADALIAAETIFLALLVLSWIMLVGGAR